MPDPRSIRYALNVPEVAVLHRLNKRPGISATDLVTLFPEGASERTLRRTTWRLEKYGYVRYGDWYMRSRMPCVRVRPLYITDFGRTELDRYIAEMFEGDLSR
jgi:hypothetical protein